MMSDTLLTRWQFPVRPRAAVAVAACALLSLLLPACDWDGNFTVLGYTTAPNYDPNIKTVRVPIFGNKTLIRGLEFDLTEAVVRRINMTRGLKAVGGGQPADTELTGTIILTTKSILIVNQLNEIREGELTVAVDLVWRDLRTGEVLSKPAARPLDPSALAMLSEPRQTGIVPGLLPPGAISPPTVPGVPAADPLAGAPAAPPPPPVPGAPAPPPVPVRVSVASSYIPELGQSNASAYQRDMEKLAVKIVSLMEKPW